MTVKLPETHQQFGTPEKVYPYRDTAGETIAAVYRFEGQASKKEIRPYCLERGAWIWPERPVLYELDALTARQNETIIIVEGEKCANALSVNGFLATTSMGGSNAAGKSDWSALKGRKVIIGPISPPIGAKALSGASVDTVPTGWDVADAIHEGWQKEQIQALLDQAERFSTVSSDSVLSTAATESAQGANDNWPEPDKIFLEDDNTPPALPLDVFPPQVQDWLTQTATSKSAPVDYVAGCLLTACASLIGTSRRILCWNGWSEPAILWTAIVGSPSAGKSPAMDPVLSVLSKMEGHDLEDHAEALRVYETDKLQSELTKEQWVKNVKSASEKGFATPIMPAGATAPELPMRKRLIIADATPEALLAAVRGQPKGLLSSWDELAGWLTMDRYSSGKGAERAMWLHAYGGRAYTLDRVKNGAEPIHIPSLAVSVLGGIQPDRLLSCLLKGDDDGLSARFLYIYPNSAPRERPLHVPDGRIFQRIVDRLNALSLDMDANQQLVGRSIPLSSDGALLFLPWWQWIEDRCADNPRMAGWWGKAQGLCLRLALLFEYIAWAASPNGMEPTEISARSIESAIKFMEAYAGPMAERAHGIASKTTREVNMRRLALYILENGLSEFTVRQLSNGSPLRTLKAQGIKDACFDLVGYGWLIADPVRQGATAGKSQERFLVNPAL